MMALQITFPELQRLVRGLGMTAKRTEGHDKEVRVNFIDGREASAYYTEDLDDALGTAIHMWRESEKRRHAAVASNRKTTRPKRKEVG